MNNWLWIAIAFVVVLGCGLSVYWMLTSFMRYPHQNAIRSMLAIFVAFVGSLAIPTVNGTVTVDLDWGWLLSIQGNELTISNGATKLDYFVVCASLTILLAVCFLKVPAKVRE